MKEIEIRWEDLQVGDKFPDGSVVLSMEDWVYKPCYEIKLVGNDPLVISEDHLFNFKIVDENDNCVDMLEHSAIHRAKVMESDENWFTAKDLFSCFGKFKLIPLSANGESRDKIEYIKEYKNLKPQKCRCITTNTGHYEINSLINHNTARKLFYGMSNVQVIDDCGGDHRDVLHCSAPGGRICKKCAEKVQGGQGIKVGDFAGGIASTALSEGLTQANLSKVHTTFSDAHTGESTTVSKMSPGEVIMATFDNFSTSEIILQAREEQTTEGRRKVLFDGIKKAYKDAGIKCDDINIQIAVRSMTSTKRDKDTGIRKPVKDDELCDISSMMSLGNADNLFNQIELSSGYKILTKPTKQKIARSATTEIL